MRVPQALWRSILSMPIWCSASALIAILSDSIFASQISAQEIGRLYAPRPPAGSAFVRVVGASDLENETVRIGDLSAGKNTTLGRASTRYRAVAGGKPVSISIGGSFLDGPVVPPADRFSTVVVTRNGNGFSSYSIDEGEGGSNDLKAQLRFFNLAKGCDASLKVVGGPTVFELTAPMAVRSRTVSPVKAELEAICNGRTAPLSLPQLRAGDHYSLFLRGESGDTVSSSGEFDETEPYPSR